MAEEGVAEDPEVLLTQAHHSDVTQTVLASCVLIVGDLVGVGISKSDFQTREILLVLGDIGTFASKQFLVIFELAFEVVDGAEQVDHALQLLAGHSHVTGTGIDDGVAGALNHHCVTDLSFLEIKRPVVRIRDFIPGQSLVQGKSVHVVATCCEHRRIQVIVILVRDVHREYSLANHSILIESLHEGVGLLLVRRDCDLRAAG